MDDKESKGINQTKVTKLKTDLFLTIPKRAIDKPNWRMDMDRTMQRRSTLSNTNLVE